MVAMAGRLVVEYLRNRQRRKPPYTCSVVCAYAMGLTRPRMLFGTTCILIAYQPWPLCEKGVGTCRSEQAIRVPTYGGKVVAW